MAAPAPARCARCHTPVRQSPTLIDADYVASPYRGLRLTCAVCMAVLQRQTMQTLHRIILEAVQAPSGQWVIQNTCGSLQFPATMRHRTYTGQSRGRYDFWFRALGHTWWGTPKETGSHLLIRCRVIKASAAADAEDPDTDPHLLLRLARHRSDWIRALIAENPATPFAGLVRLAKDRTRIVRDALQRRTDLPDALRIALILQDGPIADPSVLR